jgi:hypothetical protein
MRPHHIGVIFVIALSVCAHAQQPDFSVSQMLRLTTAANGIDGALQVLTDSRLTEELKQEMWGAGDWSFILPEEDPRRSAFERNPPRNAELRIVTNTNQVLRSFSLERPLARVIEARVVGIQISFLVTVDYPVGFGSYAGVETLLLDVVDGQFRWAEATDIDTKKAEQIRLWKTLKATWKLVPFRRNHDILLVYCRPPKVQVGNELVVGYVRYRFDGKQWLKHEQQQKGFWESDEPFPPLSKFPMNHPVPRL